MGEYKGSLKETRKEETKQRSQYKVEFSGVKERQWTLE